VNSPPNMADCMAGSSMPGRCTAIPIRGRDPHGYQGLRRRESSQGSVGSLSEDRAGRARPPERGVLNERVVFPFACHAVGHSLGGPGAVGLIDDCVGVRFHRAEWRPSSEDPHNDQTSECRHAPLVGAKVTTARALNR
jgi:hypothetical protein